MHDTGDETTPMTTDAGDRTLPAGIGPHAGRELELMLAGRKPLAMFSDQACASGWFPEDSFQPYVSSGLFVRRMHIYRNVRSGLTTRHFYVARVGEAWRIERMHRLYFEIHCCGRPATHLDHVEIGRLLGYPEDDISAFLRHVGSVNDMLAAAPRRAA